MANEPTLSAGYLLLVALAVTVAMQLAFFAAAFKLQVDKLTDFAGTLNFAVLAIGSLLIQNVYSSRGVAVTALQCIWALRLGVHLVLRVLRRGRDARFDEMRADWRAFLGFWVFQMLWAWIVSLPVLLANSVGSPSSRAFGSDARDIVGLVVWLVGFALEWAADATKESFYSQAENRSRFLDRGVWRYSRHPNYFGEILCWTGVAILASAAFASTHSPAWFYVLAALSPSFTAALLLLLSGAPLAEARSDERFGADPLYWQYKATTSPVVCLPPAVYGSLPMWVKRVLLFEWPLYSRRQRRESAADYQAIP